MGTARVPQVGTFAGPEAAEAWRRSAAVRDAYMASTTRTLFEMVGLKPGSQVLVLGAGTGGEALDAARRVGPGGRVVATDLSASMVSLAREAAARGEIGNIEFAVMDAQHLEFPAGSFDAVTSRNVLMFIPDVALGLSEMKRVLKPGGRVGASVWSTVTRNPRISGPLAAARALGASPPESATYRLAVRLGTPALLRGALRAAGFGEIQTRGIRLVADYADLETAVTSSLEQPGTRELLSMLDSHSKARMRRGLERRWARYADDTGVHLPGEQLIVAATA